MPIKFSGKSVGSYNKSPQKPSPPDPDLFDAPIEAKDGRVIWRSYPQPDRLRIEAVLSEKHFGGSDQKPITEEALIAQFAQGLHGAQQTLAGTSPYIPPSQGYANEFLVPLGSRGSRVLLKIRKAKAPGLAVSYWKLGVHLTPRKLKSDGLSQLVEMLAYATPSGFDVGALLADARVRELDVATDFVGVRPIDLWLNATKREGKRVNYQGADGELETTYLHSFKRPPKVPTKIRNPLGTLLARCYSRDRERAAYGKPPPYTQGHTTRLEVSLKRFKVPIYLPELAGIGDPFERVRLSYVGEQIDLEADRWSAYVSLRHSSPHGDASAFLGLDPKTAKQFDQTLRKNTPDLIPHSEIPGLWAKGLDASGMSALLEVAKGN